MSFEENLKKIVKSGKIRETLPDKVDLKLYRSLIHSLEWISVGYSSALYFAGKRLGKEILTDNIKGTDINSILKEIASLFDLYGIGKLEIGETSGEKTVVRLIESATSFNMEKVGKPVCFFEAGIIAGILEGKLKKKVLVNETMCGGLGDKVDEFVIKVG